MKSVLIGTVWPSANRSLHLGQIGGVYLPADIFARYNRVAGNQVVMVGGTDQFGTPVVILAQERGVDNQEVMDQFHAQFLRSWRELGISYDLYTSTGTECHQKTAQDFFQRLYDQGNLYLDTMELTYCALEERFLPDRYVLGTCPSCGDVSAHGNRCDACGRPLETGQLIDPRCAFDGTRPEQRSSEHLFLRLSDYNDRLREWLSTGKDHWRRPVLNFSLGVLNGEGLRDRAVTRDLDWGVAIPIAGFENKRIYVWFENVIGYLSATKEWSAQQGRPEGWRDFWCDPEARIYYFIGKASIWFHCLSWPAQVMMHGGLNQPYDVTANHSITYEGPPPFLLDYLARYDPDTVRYYLAAIMPEVNDSEFSEAGLIRRNNEELVSTWGNLVNRVLQAVYRGFDARIPEPGELARADLDLLQRGQAMLDATSGSLSTCRFREALRTTLQFAQDVNRYLNQEQPWKASSKASAARVLYTALSAIEMLKIGFYPFIPFSSTRLHAMLGHDDQVEANGWQPLRPLPGAALPRPVPLFKKLEPIGVVPVGTQSSVAGAAR